MSSDTRCGEGSSSREEQRERIDKLAKSISGLCHTVIARRLGQFFEVIGEEVQKNQYRRPSVGTGSMNAPRHGMADSADWMRGWNACLDALDAAEAQSDDEQESGR